MRQYLKLFRLSSDRSYIIRDFTNSSICIENIIKVSKNFHKHSINCSIPLNRRLHTNSINMAKALVLGTYQIEDANGKTTNKFTDSASELDRKLGGKLASLVNEFGPNKKGKAKTFYGLTAEFPVISVVGLGPTEAGFNEAEDLDEKRENIRSSIATGARSVRDENNIEEILLDPCTDAEAAAEGAHLALWNFDELKDQKYKKKAVKVSLYNLTNDKSVQQVFDRGVKLAESQNICRRLGEMPANLMTPTIFCETAKGIFKNVSNVKLIVRDEKWAEEKKMGSFLSVGHGSDQPSKFLEIHYNNKPDSKPVVFVGKGVCFDSGGISLKPGSNMDKMRADMMGAANVVSTIFALASLSAQVNIIGLTPLVENLPSGKATKPGDVVYAMNGKSIQVDNTDAEGRLILADALCYAHEFDPEVILDIATLTGAMMVAIGSCLTGVFSTSTKLYEQLKAAGSHTGDRVWRFPLYTHYRNQVTDPALADVLNTSKSLGLGGSCTAAAFLHEFVKCSNWLHLDIAGVMENKDNTSYDIKGMSGRPTRTLYYFFNDYFNKKA